MSEVGKKDAIGNRKKPRLSLIPIEALWALGDALTYGEQHYGTNNWRAGLPITVLLDAAMRHISQFANGETHDKDSGCHHLGSAMANLSFAIWMTIFKPNFDDRYKHENNTK